MANNKAKFNDFKDEYKQSTLGDDVCVQNLFQKLSEDDAINDMISSIKCNRPALEGVMPIVISMKDQLQLENNSVRQSIGMLIAFILRPYGYFPDKGKRIAKGDIGEDYFTSAATYQYIAEKAKVKIVHISQDIDN